MRAIIFDLGRVLIHYEHQKTLAGLVDVSCATPVEVQTLFGRVAGDLNIGRLGAEDLHRFFKEHAGACEDLDAFVTAFGAGMSRMEDALSYVLELQARPEVTIGVISNTNEAHVCWLDEYVPELQQLDLVMMSNEVGIAKPDPEIFHLALELLGVKPAQAIFIDDLAENVVAAQQLGLSGIVHTDWALTRPALEHWLANGQLP